MTDWTIVIPFKGTPDAKSRLGPQFDARARTILAFAFLVDTVKAVFAASGVTRVVVVSHRKEILEGLCAAIPDALHDLEAVEDPGGGINAAVAAGIRHARSTDADSFIAVLTGDLATLRPSDLEKSFVLAADAAEKGHRMSYVPDQVASGTTMVAFAPRACATTRFGPRSNQAHAAAGYRPLAIDTGSSLRLDVDTAEDLARARRRGLGAATAAALDDMKASTPLRPGPPFS